jgi:hypothetical protein
VFWFFAAKMEFEVGNCLDHNLFFQHLSKVFCFFTAKLEFEVDSCLDQMKLPVNKTSEEYCMKMSRK